MALRKPGYNAGLIHLEGLEKLDLKGDQAHLRKLNVATDRDMIQFSAKISPAPLITYGAQNDDRQNNRGQFNRGQSNRGPQVKIAALNLADARFIAPKNVAALHVLGCRSALPRGAVGVFAQEMATTLDELGIKVRDPTKRSYNKELSRESSLYEELPTWF